MSMSLKNYSARRRTSDCWNARLLQNACYSTTEELPLFNCSDAIPNDVLSFKYISSRADTSKWIHFFGDDNRIEAVWDSPELWAENLKRFPGVISPDFSVCRDMPIKQQEYNIYRNRVLAHWFDQNGIPVIPNVRWADKRSYDTAFDGLPQNGTFCVSTCGTLSHQSDRDCFTQGLAELMKTLHPATLLVYGSMPTAVFSVYQTKGVRLIQYASDTAKAHKRGEW